MLFCCYFVVYLCIFLLLTKLFEIIFIVFEFKSLILPINFLTTVGPNAEVIVVGPDENKNKVKYLEDKSSWPVEIRIIFTRVNLLVSVLR